MKVGSKNIILSLLLSLFLPSKAFAFCTGMNESACNSQTQCSWSSSASECLDIPAGVNNQENAQQEEEPERAVNPNQGFFDSFQHDPTHTSAFNQACKELDGEMGRNRKKDESEWSSSYCDPNLVNYNSSSGWDLAVQVAAQMYAQFFGAQGIAIYGPGEKDAIKDNRSDIRSINKNIDGQNERISNLDPTNDKDEINRLNANISEQQQSISDIRKENKETRQSNTSGEDKKEMPDYCAYGAMVGEEVGKTMEQDSQRLAQYQLQIADADESIQYQSLESLADIHNAKREASVVQGGTWTAASACYASLMMFGPAKPNGINITKLATTAFLGTYFFRKAKRHKDHRDAIRKKADELPLLGECNPSNPSCFCTDESEVAHPQEYLKYCVPADLADSYQYTPCLDANQNIDPTCECKKTNPVSCYTGASSLGGANFSGAITGPFTSIYDSIGAGEYGNGFITKARKGLAFAKKVLNSAEIQKKIPAPGKLTPSQKKAAKMMAKDFGIPLKAAALATTSPMSKKLLARYMKGNTKVPSRKKFVSSMRRRPSMFKNKKSDSKNNYAFPTFGKKKQEDPQGGIQMANYSRKITSRAEIHQDNRVIFDIISSRYKKSAWKILE
jgi:hypothetical protein